MADLPRESLARDAYAGDFARKPVPGLLARVAIACVSAICVGVALKEVFARLLELAAGR